LVGGAGEAFVVGAGVEEMESSEKERRTSGESSWSTASARRAMTARREEGKGMRMILRELVSDWFEGQRAGGTYSEHGKSVLIEESPGFIFRDYGEKSKKLTDEVLHTKEFKRRG